MKFALAIISIFILLSSCTAIRNTEGKTNIKSKHNYDNNVFKTNSKFEYKVHWIRDNDTLQTYIINHLNDTISYDRAELSVVPGKFFGQTKMLWKYLNIEDSIVKTITTGLVEDSSHVWIHPPREGIPCIYIESSTFPSIELPAFANKQWKSKKVIPKGSYEAIGIDNSIVDSKYTISGKEEITTLIKEFRDIWKVESSAQSKLGLSRHEFYYDDKMGFVYSEYTFSNGDKLILNLFNYSLN